MCTEISLKKGEESIQHTTKLEEFSNLINLNQVSIFFFASPRLCGEQLLHQLQFLNNICCAPKFVNNKQHITYIYTNGAVQIFIESYFMA